MPEEVPQLREVGDAQVACHAVQEGTFGSRQANSIIPFRSVIREISGAAAHDRRYNAAVYAGVVRRSFLKGIGQQRGCKYPSAPEPASLK